jgi:glycosyltransferase involved in cell wall biosynthesis
LKRVLIITYYWPPSGGAGVQRMLKLVKYIREFGWEPVVYTAENAAYPVLDTSLEKDIPPGVEIWKHPIWEPYEAYKRFTGKKKSQQVFSGFMQDEAKSSISEKLALWIRANFFIPDARAFWIKPSVNFLLKQLRSSPVDAIISTGPPHSAHLIAKGVRQQLNIPWLADFRDPWTKIDYYHTLPLTKHADAKHRRLEKAVLQNADAIECVSWHWADDFSKMCGKPVTVITNGFDEDDFIKKDIPPQTKFSINHIGSINKDRNHTALWRALQHLCNIHQDFASDLHLSLIGKNDAVVFRDIEKHGLTPYLERIDYLPHNEIFSYQCSAAVLLLPLGNMPSVHGLLPGKLFEYLAAKRPIVVIGPADGDSARIVRETQSGVCFDFNDEAGMKEGIYAMYQQWKAGNLNATPKDIEKYSRRNIAQQFATLLNTLIK